MSSLRQCCPWLCMHGVLEGKSDHLGELTPTQSAHRQLELKNGEGITQGTIFRCFLNGENVSPSSF